MNLSNMNEHLHTARLVRDVLLRHLDDLPQDFLPNDSIGGLSLPEFYIAFFVSDADREQVAHLFHDAVQASGSIVLIRSFVDDMRACAAVDFGKLEIT